MAKLIAVIAAVILAAFAVATPASAGTGVINVTPQGPGGSSFYSDLVFIRLTAPDGSITAALGSRGNITTFTGLEAGTYELFLQGLGGIIDEPIRQGEATVTLEEGATVDITVQLVAIPFPVIDVAPF